MGSNLCFVLIALWITERSRLVHLYGALQSVAREWIIMSNEVIQRKDTQANLILLLLCDEWRKNLVFQVLSGSCHRSCCAMEDQRFYSKNNVHEQQRKYTVLWGNFLIVEALKFFTNPITQPSNVYDFQLLLLPNVSYTSSYNKVRCLEDSGSFTRHQRTLALQVIRQASGRKKAASPPPLLSI